MKTKLISSCVLSLAILSLTGCFKQNIDTSKLADLQRLSTRAIDRNAPPSISPIRLQAIQETAMSMAAQSGLANRAKDINKLLLQRAPHLDKVFNFEGLMLARNVLPPVLLEGRESLNLTNSETIRLADMTYQIADQARFVTTPPTWRTYLWLDYKIPPVPNKTLLPKDRDERLVWNKYITSGWKQGEQQANAIFKENLAKLKRDYAGMVLYRKLLAQNIVSAPYVATTNLGITGGGANMRVNDQVLRITALPTLQMDSKRWKPAFSSKQNE